MKILDLGCGLKKVAGSIGVDNVNLDGVDVVHDLRKFPYPFDDGSFDRIHLRHVIEHFEIEGIEEILKEAHRILVLKGVLHIAVPHVFSIEAHSDITHRKFFTFSSGKFWDKDNPKNYYQNVSAKWQLINIWSRVTWFNWKRYRMKILDRYLSKFQERKLDRALTKRTNPSLADRIIKRNSFQFVEINWELQKVN